MKNGTWFTIVLFLIAAGAAAYTWSNPGVLEKVGVIKTAQPAGSDANSEAKTEKQPGSESGSKPAPQKSSGRNGPQGPTAVEAIAAKAATTTTDIAGIGTLQSDESVQLASEISGRISAISFEEGHSVKEGDKIVTLDDALVKAEVADAEARYALAQSNLERARALSKTGNVTEKAQDEATSNFGIAKAAVELAKVRLSKHEIIAPFSGVVGTRLLSVGAFVNAGTPMVNLEKIDKLKVSFKLPEIHLAEIKVGQQIELTVDALPKEKFTGEIYAIDPQVDVNGRALNIRATLPNDHLKLRPGLFARITVKGGVTREVVLVPESTIVPRGGETFVYKIKDSKVTETKVKLGQRKDAKVEVIEGLSDGDQVVSAGQQKLRNGAQVEIVQAERPVVKQGS